MNFKKLLTGLTLSVLSTAAFAAATRTLDGQQITNGAATLTIPTSTDTLVGRATTDTLTNKSISGATNTLSNIPTSAISSGQLGVANGGTGASTLTANGVLQGNGTSAVSAVTGSQYQTLQYGSGGVPTAGAVNLNQSAAVSGQLPVANGGTGLGTLTSGSVIVGNGTGTPAFIAPGTNGNVLTSVAGVWTSTAPASVAPALNGGSASPQSVTAAGGISLSGLTYLNQVWVAGSAGAVTVTKTPSITACTADGQQLKVIGTSATNTVTLQDQANLASSGLSLNGNWVGGKDSTLILHCDITQGLWVEDSRR